MAAPPGRGITSCNRKEKAPNSIRYSKHSIQLSDCGRSLHALAAAKRKARAASATRACNVETNDLHLVRKLVETDNFSSQPLIGKGPTALANHFRVHDRDRPQNVFLVYWVEYPSQYFPQFSNCLLAWAAIRQPAVTITLLPAQFHLITCITVRVPLGSAETQVVVHAV